MYICNSKTKYLESNEKRVVLNYFVINIFKGADFEDFFFLKHFPNQIFASKMHK